MNFRRTLLLLLLSISGAHAVVRQVRELSVPSLERLGNELIRTSQRPDRGATDPVRNRARQTARAALKNKLFDVNYDAVVLNDPDGKGFLVYALALADTKRVLQTGGHYRVTVSADGGTVEKIDLLSGFTQQKLDKRTLMIVSTQHSGHLPAETWLYTSHIYRLPVMLGTKEGAVWWVWTISNGKMHKSPKPLDPNESKPRKK